MQIHAQLASHSCVCVCVCAHRCPVLCGTETTPTCFSAFSFFIFTPPPPSLDVLSPSLGLIYTLIPSPHHIHTYSLHSCIDNTQAQLVLRPLLFSKFTLLFFFAHIPRTLYCSCSITKFTIDPRQPSALLHRTLNSCSNTFLLRISIALGISLKRQSEASGLCWTDVLSLLCSVYKSIHHARIVSAVLSGLAIVGSASRFPLE